MVIFMTLTGQLLSAACASAIFESSKLPVDLPLLVPPTTFDFPSESLSK